ncbi:hypothetical protein KSP40_PGU022832 [Platanthera guangdongensis]|uniref:Uncharacterized protein n=1 Tax=Platanthera guangdongensis TaxID=2320717 RepID=A0ABR2LZW1_9ASPA
MVVAVMNMRKKRFSASRNTQSGRPVLTELGVLILVASALDEVRWALLNNCLTLMFMTATAMPNGAYFFSWRSRECWAISLVRPEKFGNWRWQGCHRQSPFLVWRSGTEIGCMPLLCRSAKQTLTIREPTPNENA